MKIKCLFTLIILATLFFSHCNAHIANKQETEPPIISMKVTEPAPSDKSIEKIEEKEPPMEIEKKGPVPNDETTLEKRLEIKTPTINTPTNTSNGIPDNKIMSDHITTGISDIFKEFGYFGEVEVPESFKNRVAYYIRYFSFDEKGSHFFQRSIKRAAEYLPMIRKVFQDKKLPLSLVYLPLVESGFNPNARSRVGAVGMWQFMMGTARNYGLKISRRIDERKDPVRATEAAAEYINDLLAMFGMEDPFLGICAYNAGEGKILSCLRQISYKERSFWTLVRKNLLHNETDEYIPRLLATILITRDPQTYAEASKAVSIESNDTEDQEIIDSIHTAPPTPDAETGDEPESEPVPKLETNIDVQAITRTGTEIETSTETGKRVGTEPVWVYRVKSGDTLFSIAKKYNVIVNTLQDWNQLDGNLIYPGQELKFYKEAPKNTVNHRTGGSRAVNNKGYKLIYTVNYKDSLAHIALFFKGVTVRDIMKWNRLNRTRIYLKQELVIYLEQPPRKIATHIVKNGETVAKIARKYGQRLEYVLSLNGMVTDSPLLPGKRLRIYYF